MLTVIAHSATQNAIAAGIPLRLLAAFFFLYSVRNVAGSHRLAQQLLLCPVMPSHVPLSNQNQCTCLHLSGEVNMSL